jgi:hypothetical protein
MTSQQYSPKKPFKLRPDQIRSLAEGRGSCIASDRITVDGKPVGYMYREAPRHSVDSGWHFFAGDESQEYANNSRNFEMYNINTIANYDPEVIPFLDAAFGTAWARNAEGKFESEKP